MEIYAKYLATQLPCKDNGLEHHKCSYGLPLRVTVDTFTGAWWDSLQV